MRAFLESEGELALKKGHFLSTEPEEVNRLVFCSMKRSKANHG